MYPVPQPLKASKDLYSTNDLFKLVQKPDNEEKNDHCRCSAIKVIEEMKPDKFH